MASSTTVGAQTLLITVGRTAAFHTCNTYLSRSLLKDLQSLTFGHEDISNPDSDALEMDTLPVPGSSKSTETKQLKSTALHSNISRWSFSLCFSESCTLFAIFMCQEIGLLYSESRLFNWKLSIFILIAMILLIIPLTQNLLLTYQLPRGPSSRKRSLLTRLLLVLLPYSIYLFCLSLVPLPEGMTSTTVSASSLARLVILGTFIIGLLSGIGAARNVLHFLPLLSGIQRPIPTESEVIAAEDALSRVRRDMQERRNEERKYAESRPEGSSSWMSRMIPGLGNSDLTAIQREIDGLVALEYQMSKNVEEMKRSRMNAQYSKTFIGRIMDWVGIAFAIYCIFRTISSIFNILLPYRSTAPSNDEKASYPDLIAHLLTYLFSLLPSVHMSEERISAVSRQMSLALVGAIIMSSVRFVLKAVSRILRLTSQNLGASLLLLILAQLMGTYLISTLVQLRTAFPPAAVPIDNEDASASVLSTLPAYEMFGSAFDWSYLLSAFATATYIWFERKVNGSDWGE